MNYSYELIKDYSLLKEKIENRLPRVILLRFADELLSEFLTQPVPDFNPSPEYPLGHGHLKLPTVLTQPMLHGLFFPALHSFTSIQK